MEKIKRLAEVIDYLKQTHSVNSEELSRVLGYRSSNYISDMVGGSKAINPLFLGRLNKYYDVNPDYIEHGTPPKIIDKSTDDSDYISKRRLMKIANTDFRVPLVSVKARAGYARSYDSIDLVESLDKYAIPPGVSYAGAIWRYFEVDGDSMEPALSAGDLVLCSQVPQEDWDNLKNFYVYVIVTAETVVIKRVFVKDSGDWVLISDNEHHTPQKLFDKKELKELWVFRRLIKKTISPKKEFKIKI